MTTNRAARITKIHKVLKKHYQPVAPPPERPVLEHLLYACCLENARHEQADEAFAKLQESFFDWNEIRVTTVSELSETLSALPDAPEAAARLKGALQAVFEAHYAFDIDFLRKENLGKAVKELEKYSRSTPFVVAYVTQNALSGHAIPVNNSGIELFQILDVISPAEAADHRIPGLERAVPKNKGCEFGSLFHQLTFDYQSSPFSTRVRSIVLEIDPDAKDRLPKRGARKSEPEEAPAERKPKKNVGRGDGSAKAKPPAKVKKTAKPGQPEAKRKKSTAKAAPSKKTSSKRLTQKKPR